MEQREEGEGRKTGKRRKGIAESRKDGEGRRIENRDKESVGRQRRNRVDGDKKKNRQQVNKITHSAAAEILWVILST